MRSSLVDTPRTVADALCHPHASEASNTVEPDDAKAECQSAIFARGKRSADFGGFVAIEHKIPWPDAPRRDPRGWTAWRPRERIGHAQDVTRDSAVAGFVATQALAAIVDGIAAIAGGVTVIGAVVAR